jgi:hypothetical protein
MRLFDQRAFLPVKGEPDLEVQLSPACGGRSIVRPRCSMPDSDSRRRRSSLRWPFAAPKE